MPRQLDLVRVDVDGYDALARERKLDRVPAHPAETVHNDVTLASE